MTHKRKDRRLGDHSLDHYPCILSPAGSKRGRVSYLNWATELYGYLDRDLQGIIEQWGQKRDQGPATDESINLEVRSAVEKLSPDERRFVELFYFEFRSYREISRKLRKKTYKLERIHARAVEKLRILLGDFVRQRFGLDVPPRTDCMICMSPHRRELEQLIRDKTDEETYSRLMRTFRKKHGVKIKTPQVIIGHRKKHMV
jgi:RNA polymerase sigma factor (sigma-70 family)